MSVLAMLERARLAERQGEHGRASELYRYVAEVWRRADPSLRPYVEEARAGAGRMEAAEER